MLEEDCLADGWLIMDALATVSVATGANLIEEGTVDFVHLRAIDFGKPLRHSIIFIRVKLFELI
jgi:hypothetical protein